MDKQNEASTESSTETFDDTFATHETSTQESIITSGRIGNVAIAVACVAAMISCIVCLGVMEAKHNAIIGQIDPDNTRPQRDKEVCMLYSTVNETVVVNSGQTTTQVLKFNKSHVCQFVIYGSGIIGGLLLIAATYYIIRLFIMRR